MQVIVVGVVVVLGMVVVAVVGYCYVINVGVVVTAFVRVNFFDVRRPELNVCCIMVVLVLVRLWWCV